MRNNPVTRDYLDEELIPLLEDMLSGLMDDPTVLDRPGAVFVEYFDETKVVNIAIKLFKPDAARIIGKEHSTRKCVYQLFQAILRNHGYNLRNYSVVGLNEDGSTATVASTTMEEILRCADAVQRMNQKPRRYQGARG